MNNKKDNEVKSKTCPKCKKDPCVCDKKDGPKGEESRPRTEAPKISWI